MMYPDGQTARLGDRVCLGADIYGILVCSIDTSEYSEEYSRDDWVHLNGGVLILFEALGLIHYSAPEQNLRLISRRS